MSAEKSFLLIVDKERKNEVITKLGKVCLNDSQYSIFNSKKLENNSTLCVSLDIQAELEYYTDKNEYTKRISGKYTFGLIHVTLEEYPKYISFELWPLANSLFDVLNKSDELRECFIDLIVSTNGYEFNINNGDGSFEYVFHNRNYDD